MDTKTDSKRRTLLFVLPSYAGGGAERVVLNLANGLSVNGTHDVHLAVFDAIGPYIEMRQKAVIEHQLKTLRIRNSLNALVKLSQTLRPDILFSTFVHVNLPLLTSRPVLPKGTSIVVREANLPSLSLRRLRFTVLWRLATRLLYPTADAVVVSSERMSDEFSSDFAVPTSKLFHLNNPVDVDAIRRTCEPLTRSPGQGRRFVAAGRLVPQKGFDRLIEIAKELPPDDRIEIYGDGPERANLSQALDNSTGQVKLCGHTAQLAPKLAGADAFLLPSRFEGMPNVALEALACGTRVIATPECGGIAEVAEAAMPSAVKVATIGEAFLNEMKKVEPRRAAKGAAPSLLPEKFHVSSVVKELEALFDEAIRRRLDKPTKQ